MFAVPTVPTTFSEAMRENLALIKELREERSKAKVVSRNMLGFKRFKPDQSEGGFFESSSSGYKK